MSSDWQDVAPEAELAPGQRCVIALDDMSVLVININGGLFALEDRCSHDNAPLGDGAITDDQIICPRHGARFCLRTGAALTPPAYEPVAALPVRIHEGMIQIRDNRWD